MATRRNGTSSTTILVLIILVLLVIIGILVWKDFPAMFVPTKAVDTHVVATSSTKHIGTTAASSTEPLSASVTVTLPHSGSTVGQSFDIAGVAPNGWYFEAVFPIQVRDPNDNLIATAQGQAQSDWTINGPVAFKAAITLNEKYSGPADLILLRDNPSGLPENSDEVTVPIVIK